MQLPKVLEEMDIDTIVQAIIADEPDLEGQQDSLREALSDRAVKPPRLRRGYKARTAKQFCVRMSKCINRDMLRLSQ